jgi:hypothetical protein
MPRRKRPGEWTVLYVEVPPALKAQMQAKADENRRSLAAEVMIALEKHVGRKAARSEKK